MKIWRKAFVISSLISSLAVPLFLCAVPSNAQPNLLTQLFPALVGIQLKPQQQLQLEQLSQQTLPKVQHLLSAEQLKRFNAALLQNQSVRVALLSLDLSIPQKLELRNVLQSVRSQIAQTLTPEQQRQMMQNFRSLSLSR
jgi:hypothetical protein